MLVSAYVCALVCDLCVFSTTVCIHFGLQVFSFVSKIPERIRLINQSRTGERQRVRGGGGEGRGRPISLDPFYKHNPGLKGLSKIFIKGMEDSKTRWMNTPKRYP